jgi:hypothetical protein
VPTVTEKHLRYPAATTPRTEAEDIDRRGDTMDEGAVRDVPDGWNPAVRGEREACFASSSCDGVQKQSTPLATSPPRRRVLFRERQALTILSTLCSASRHRRARNAGG